MVVRIRLARFGRRNLPFYHIVVANARTARNSKPIEKIGTYNPIPDETGNKMINLNFDRAKYWLTVGAQPSETVEKLLVKVKVIYSQGYPYRIRTLIYCHFFIGRFDPSTTEALDERSSKTIRVFIISISKKGHHHHHRSHPHL